MKSNFLKLSLTLLIFLLIYHVSFAYNGFKANYELHLTNRAVFHNNSIIIESISNDKISGKITLDFNIGAIARMPHPWERAHTISFAGKFNSETQFLNFSIKLKLNKEFIYNFKGYFIYVNEKDFKPYKAIVGSYYIDNRVVGGFFAKEKK